MLLSTYLAARGQLPMDTPAASSFAAIRAFLFGEEYTVEVTLDGQVMSYRFDDLTDALEVMTSEYEADERFAPSIQIVSYTATRDPKFGMPVVAVGERAGYRPREMDVNRFAAFVASSSANPVPTFGPAPERVLAVTRVDRNMMFPRPPMAGYAEEIRNAVTFYSLRGTWDQFDGRTNL